MTQAKLVQPPLNTNAKKKRVAAYCRVSSNSADQLNSYSNQIRFYTKLIQQRNDWTLVDIFADEGISGTQAKNRPEFQRMIKACQLHQIDIIVTKSVSRFARNVPEALEYIRELKLLGVGVQFEKEGIYTLALGDEMLLNTFAAIAQEESKAISQHTRTSILKRMQSGEFVDNNAPCGYILQNKKLEIYEPEAKIIRTIFKSYLNGKSTGEIAQELTEQQICTRNGSHYWTRNRITYILSNEKYAGDSLYQKKYRDQNVPFKQYRNKGQEDMYYAKGTHSPIVSADEFAKVQELLTSRRKHYSECKPKIQYSLTSRIRCSECGSFYRRKVRGGTVKWVCANHYEDTSICDSNYYDESRIYDGIITIINKLRFGKEHIIKRVIHKLEEAAAFQKKANKKAMDISVEISNLNSKLVMLEQLRAKSYLTPEVYHSQSLTIKNQIKELNAQRKGTFVSHIQAMLNEMKKLQSILDEIEEPLEIFNEQYFNEIVKDIVINKYDEMTVTVIGNIKFTERI